MNNDIKALGMFNLIGFMLLSILITIYAMMLDNKIEQNTGAAHSPLTSLSPQAAPTFEANVSAYCPCEKCCGEFSDGITASGHVIQKGDKFVAAPKGIPFGTMIDIPGYGLVPVLDRGGAIKGNKLDVFFPTHEEALQWGRQYLTVRIGE